MKFLNPRFTARLEIRKLKKLNHLSERLIAEPWIKSVRLSDTSLDTGAEYGIIA
jgi:hypothetical protein